MGGDFHDLSLTLPDSGTFDFEALKTAVVSPSIATGWPFLQRQPLAASL